MVQSASDTKTNEKVILELICYNRENYVKIDNLPIEKLLAQVKSGNVNWINIDGLHDSIILEKVQNYFNLHSLLIEDVVTDQRPKSEEFDDYLFFTLKMLYRIDNDAVDYEQISFVMGKNFLISFQEKEGDLFDPFRERIRLDLGRVRKKDADYLLYRLIDIIVDSYYTILDHFGEVIEGIEDSVYIDPNHQTFLKIQTVRKELILLRKAINPVREALNRIIKGESDFVKEENLHFYSDVYDHVIHVIESIDTFKDLTSSLMDIHMNSMNTKMNEVIKVLTVISTIFIPLTFIVGVYGMNFDLMPELKWKYGYLMVWGIMLLVVLVMLRFFKYKKWF